MLYGFHTLEYYSIVQMQLTVHVFTYMYVDQYKYIETNCYGYANFTQAEKNDRTTYLKSHPVALWEKERNSLCSDE